MVERRFENTNRELQHDAMRRWHVPHDEVRRRTRALIDAALLTPGM
ncbi:MAG: hypothetical protein HY322_11020 [Betaproteobacteria bacterium]|nr:hypothetical protein [Betaproteobacteria bacterium]